MNQTELLSLLDKLKAEVRNSDAWKDLCKENSITPDHIFLIPTCFAKLDVSARTENGIVYLNYKLLEDPKQIESYLIHEYTHWLQQALGDGPTEGSTDDNYLDNPFEQDGFRAQTSFIEETEGEDEAEAYIDQVLDHHDVPQGEREDRKKELLAIVKNIELQKQAGLFTIPNEIPDIVYNTVMDKFAAKVWAYTIGLLKEETDKQVLIDKNLLINECKKYTRGPLFDSENLFAAGLSLQLITDSINNWSYAKRVLKDTRPIYLYYRLINQKKFPWPEDIPIVIHTKKQPQSGWFDIARKELHVAADASDVYNVERFTWWTRAVLDTVNHESGHLFQTLLKDITGAPIAGGVGKKYRSETESFLGVPTVKHQKITDRDKSFEEVYAPIAEDFAKSVKRFARIIKRDAGHEELMSERAKAWVGLPNSFEELAKHLGSPEPAYTDPLFLKFRKENRNNWKIIVNRFFTAAQILNKEGFRVQHSLRDIEFYTNLADSVSEFNVLAANFRPDIRLEYAKMWVGAPNKFVKLIAGQGYGDYAQEDEGYIKKWEEHIARHYPHFNKTNALFERLKVFAPKKWQKAVKEFFKAVGV